MLNDAICFKAVYIVCGYTDLRSGMDRLAALMGADRMSQTRFIFSVGGAPTASKDLYGKGDVWLLLCKRLAEGRFQSPRSHEEVSELTLQQFRWLMDGGADERPEETC